MYRYFTGAQSSKNHCCLVDPQIRQSFINLCSMHHHIHVGDLLNKTSNTITVAINHELHEIKFLLSCFNYSCQISDLYNGLPKARAVTVLYLEE